MRCSVPQFPFWIKEKDRVMPCNACWHNDAYAFPRARRCAQKHMLRAIMKHDFMIERIAPDNDAVSHCVQLCQLNILCVAKRSRAVRVHHFLAFRHFVANKNRSGHKNIEIQHIPANNHRKCLHDDGIALPRKNRQGRINVMAANRDPQT